MEIEKLVDAFISATGVDPAPAVEGIWKFSADDHVFGVTADDLGEKAFLFGELPAPSPDREEAFRKAVLEANFFGRGTGGAVFSINPESGAYTLVLSERLDRLAPESFFALVEKFVNTLATWKGMLAAAASDSAEPEPGESLDEPEDEPPQVHGGDTLSSGFMRI